ncbi:dual specificity mitogen-activated protein kinase kinase 5-like [Rhopilema esculentum]|uniref:dual specificity mitogen-activated protein kinase kinase 5-like n=1 Tax=Rhopilema esculentum TaxID=499914 RepID=UPI0031D72B30
MMANGFFNFQQGFPGNIFVIRIILPTGEATDWRIESDISFHDVLDVLNRVMPTVSPTAFEYEDEEGDRITVRSDDELQAMIQWHHWVNSQRVCNGVSKLPLLIYPRVSRSSVKRNMLGLTVDVEAAPTPQAKREGSGGGSSGRKQPGDIQNILSSGQVYQQDIHNLELMGFGNAGTVYKCLHIPTQRIIATKVIPLNVSVEVQRQIISELDILFQCNSPFVIGFHGAFFTESKISICTEYMNGGSLDTYGVIPEAVLAKISVSVVKGLVYLWNLKVMHRDVKPSNMLVNTDGKVKLCDFGVSIQLVNSIAKTYVGTNAYMAPERISGEEYGIHSDIWSLGISFAEMATGHFPYASDTRKQDDDLRVLPIDLLQCIVHEEPIPLSREQFGNDFVDFVSRCLSKAPHYRPNPEQLLEHALIKKNDDNKDDVIAAFVAQRLAEREGMEH